MLAYNARRHHVNHAEDEKKQDYAHQNGNRVALGKGAECERERKRSDDVDPREDDRLDES
jgi:hypothetical protein